MVIVGSGWAMKETCAVVAILTVAVRYRDIPSPNLLRRGNPPTMRMSYQPKKHFEKLYNEKGEWIGITVVDTMTLQEAEAVYGDYFRAWKLANDNEKNKRT